MNGSADGSGPVDGPDDEDTVLRLADDAPWHEASAHEGSRQEDPDFVERSPFGRPFVPDQAPIQRFDQRPRFESPSSATGSAAALPPSGTGRPPSAGTAPPRSGGPGLPSSTVPTALPPGIDATTGPRRRALLIPALAFGCALLLLLSIGGGLTALWFVGRDGAPAPVAGPDPTTTAPGTEPGVWEPLAPGQVPSGSPEELQRALAENPLVETRLQGPSHCTLPPVEGGKLPAAELPGFLEAGADCLETAWAGALGPAGITVEGPEVAVFTTDSPPTDSACEASRFTASAPVLCHDDNTLYWPADWDPGFSNTSAVEAPGLYMWHLSYSYTMFALAAAGLDGYYGALLLALADDPEQAEEVQRRHALQISCLSSAATFQLPQGIRPAERVEDFVTSLEAQGEPVAAGDPSQTSRASWVAAGRDSGGSLGECRTWTAAADAVA
ncbi:MAG: hypothetical protein L0H74_09770 [Brachybacterium sp.]|nr:hypothetical protein [Brachybacterium sp.]MDN5900341.1 hypothetical protein [Brachybacterium sp.]